MNRQTVFSPADILLPQCDLQKFSVVACDQYTSEPEYWEKLDAAVGNAPSALRMILPECYLCADNTTRIQAINRQMENYLKQGLFQCYSNAIIYVERTLSDGKSIRRGLVGKVDLTAYDYGRSASAPIRASEQTVADRIPPRVQIRENAPLELPHAMLLADDTTDRLFAPITDCKHTLQRVYDFDLTAHQGHLSGWLLSEQLKQHTDMVLADLAAQQKGLMFCVGDGNHSLASAKACFAANPTPVNRYALAEIVNIHEPSLEFSPIYRVVFGADLDRIAADFKAACTGNGALQKFTLIQGSRQIQLRLPCSATLAVGTLQAFLDDYLRQNPALKIDYIHSEQSVRALTADGSAVGFLFDGMHKADLFPAVAADGALPRKTFSMGQAADKRFYLEARIIR